MRIFRAARLGHCDVKLLAKSWSGIFRAIGYTRMKRLLAPHLYGEISLFGIVFVALLAILGILLLRPNAEAAQRSITNWKNQPNLVWTRAESTELERQLKANPRARQDDIQVHADMWGPGPPAADLSAIPGTAPFNAIADRLNAEHVRALRDGTGFAGSFDEENQPPDYRAMDELRLSGRTQSIAYQKALVAFRHSAFEKSAIDLAQAPCGEAGPAGASGREDPGARGRTWDIRCKWLQGRLDAAKGDGAGAARNLREALGAVEVARNAQRNSELIAALTPGDYMMTLPREGAASLWQDYLVALLIFDQPLCDRPCSEEGAVKNDDGNKVNLLTHHSAAQLYWKSFPDLAVLARLLLVREGLLDQARAIRIELDEVNNTDAATGFQVRRFDDDQREFTLHKYYPMLAKLSDVLIAEKAPAQSDDPAIARYPAIAFWTAQRSSRDCKLLETCKLTKPFDDRSRQQSAFEAFQKQWSREWTGPWYPNDSAEITAAAVVALLLVLFLYPGVWVFWAEGKRRSAEWKAVMGSAYARPRRGSGA